MSLVAVAVVLGLVVALLVKMKQVGIGAALVCTSFGVLLALSPVGPAVYDGMTTVGGWAAAGVTSL